MTRHTIYSIIATLCALCGITGCADDLDFRPTEIPEGETEVKFELSFKDFTPALASRSAGNSIESINSLWMVIYNTDGSLFASINVTDKIKTETSETMPDTKQVSFTMKMLNGTYRIYAVANMDLSGQDVTKEAYLKSLRPKWDTANVSNNAQMFGWFANGTNTVSLKDGSGNINQQLFEAAPVEISPSNKTLHALLFRLASKVTVAFDGSGLEDGISIYIKSLRIRNIPASCALGQFNEIGKSDDNTATESEEKTPVKSDDLIDTGEEIQYAPGETFDENYSALITKQNPFFPRKNAKGEDGKPIWDEESNPHSAKSPNSLFFYENNQGVVQITGDSNGLNKQPIDNNNDGILDVKYQHSKMPNATYIEVDAYYYSSNPDNPGICNITYRFMLGQNVTNDYNALRNCHYKLTLGFKGYADNPDWRIDYVTRLWVTEPHVVDYRGKYFVPDQVTSNQGNIFSDDNEIIVNSFMYDKDSWDKTEFVEFKYEFKYDGSNGFTETLPTWLTDIKRTDETDKNGNKISRLKISYKPNNISKTLDINQQLTNNPKRTNYDLSTNGGTTSMNTANCYIVDAGGTYRFPLVYGNAITDGQKNESSYIYTLGHSNSTPNLKLFKNYKNEEISDPHILKDIYKDQTIPNKITASIVWQDAPNLVTNLGIEYDETSKVGFITFNVDKPKEGNAVIALKDPDGTIMWSWHIWVTAIDYSKPLIINRPPLNPNNDTWDKAEFEIFPVNLGWCSGGIPVLYYDRHECEMKITQLINQDGQEGITQIVKIIQEPHIAVPCGNNPYYQWGRKDPFIAGFGNENNETSHTKPWYISDITTESTLRPQPLYPAKADSLKTCNAIDKLIKNPNKWNNVSRKSPGDWGNPYKPKDMIYHNLWDNSSWTDDDHVIKTIYDPCPAGYHVSSRGTFSSFSDFGGHIAHNSKNEDGETIDIQYAMFGAITENMMPTDDEWVKASGSSDFKSNNYTDNIFEFYLNRNKLISLGFPTTGYRDWDDYACIHQYGQGEIWHAQSDYWGETHNAWHFEFTRLSTGFNPHIYPYNNFYATDGMAVRPTRRLK